MRRTSIAIDITRDNHGATIRELQPEQSIFSVTCQSKVVMSSFSKIEMFSFGIRCMDVQTDRNGDVGTDEPA